MPTLSTLLHSGPVHVLAYGTLLGSQFYQSFIGGVMAYKALPRPQFSQLQQKIFPVYFTLQTVLPAVLLLTHPSMSTTSLINPSSPYFYNTGLPLLVVLGASLANLAVISPATTKVMRERKIQETKEGKKYYDEGPKSERMAALNKKFGAMHGVSGLVNLIGLLATGWYGVILGNKIRW
ncbi:hypothetical protein L873DRAFT_1682632 [Choiromyces venosus 120613-1]|uniref:TMEM205-like domain-containing protein n=1 Tax=Choiromyces venosus 120613-1 TaxID=1336337 RepID=A0A3N4JN38_9PEZI|nr:hypothetical protein L873DRAFT_1682632 [Choiromyces venosus 120613-1]